MFNKLLKDSKMQVQTNAGIINKGSYGTFYDADGEVVAKAKIQHGKRGRPPKAAPLVYFQANDLFGRVADTVKLTAPKGRTVVGKASITAVYENDTDE